MSDATGDADARLARLIGSNIQEAIKDAGITRETACSVMGCSLSVLQRMMKGEADPSALEIARLAGRTAKTVGWFAGEDPSPEARAERAADHAEKIVTTMRDALDQLLDDLAQARSVAINKPKVDPALGRVRRKNPGKVDKPITVASKPAS